MTGIPAEAITAAAEALHADRCVSESCHASGHEADRLLASVHMSGHQSADAHISRIVLEAAAPLIVADVLARVEQGIADGAAEVIAQAVAAERDRISTVTRFEVVDQDGRAFVRYDIRAELSYQDDDQTLKVFLRNERAADLLRGDQPPVCPRCPEGARLLLNGGPHCPNCGWRGDQP